MQDRYQFHSGIPNHPGPTPTPQAGNQGLNLEKAASSRGLLCARWE